MVRGCSAIATATALAAAAIYAQQMPDPYSIGITFLSAKGCPVFVAGVVPGSPGDRAGIQPGDRLLAVAGTNVGNLADAARLVTAFSSSGD